MNKTQIVAFASTQEAKSKKGLVARTVEGTYFFIPTALVGTLKVGDGGTALVITTMQTQTRDASGALIDVPADKQTPFTQATFIGTQQECIAAMGANTKLQAVANLQLKLDIANATKDLAEQLETVGYSKEQVIALF